MSPEKVWSVVEFYEKELGDKSYPPKQMTEGEYGEKYPGVYVLYCHCRWMMQHCLTVFKAEWEAAKKHLEAVSKTATTDELIEAAGAVHRPWQKAMRWMCYVQGVANAVGLYSCKELRDHSREETEDQRYQRLEREHLGDPDLKTGIYAPKPAVPATPAIPATPPKPPGGYGASSDADWDAE